MAGNAKVLTWLRDELSSHELDLVAVYRKHGASQT